MRSLALAARLARREVRRRPGRTTLVALLVALPVAAMVLAVVLYRTEHLTADELWQGDYGDADGVVYPTGPAGDSSDLQGLPDGARTVAMTSLWTRVRTAAGERSSLGVRGFDATDPMLAGVVDLVAGRFPATGDEVALAPRVAEDLAVEVGDRLSLTRPEVDLDVVGLVENPAFLSERLALVTPDAPLLTADPNNRPYVTGLVDLPAGASTEALAQDDNFVQRWPGTVGEGQSTRAVRWIYVLGAVVLTVVGIVISAAFAAGARRQLVMLGQLSAGGAPGPLLRATLVLQGTVTGLVGGLAGLGVAAGLLIAGRSTIERLLDQRISSYDVRASEVAGAVVVGVAAATVAALVPAWNVVRIPTLAALAGRRPLAPVRHRVTGAGALAVTIGLGLLGLAVLGSGTGQDAEIWAFAAIVGGVLELLGACAMAPAVVARLEPLAGHTRGVWRLAARSLARQRGRTGAVVSAVAAAAGLAVAATALVAGSAAGDPVHPELPENVVVASQLQLVGAAGDEGAGDVAALPEGDLRAELADVLDGARTVTMSTAGTQEDWPDVRLPVIADDELLGSFGFADDVRDALHETGLVSLGTGEARPATLPDGRTLTVPNVGSRVGLGGTWNVLISLALAEDQGLTPTEGALAYVSDEPLTDEQADDLENVRDDWQAQRPDGTDPYLDLSARWPEGGPTPVQIELIMAGIALAFATLVVGTSLALAAAESRDERDVLTVTGAAPGALARTAGARAWLLAGIGAAMAVPMGLLPVAVYAAADDGAMVFVVPWRSIGVLAVALPVLVAAVALAASTMAQALRPVRVSTAVFD